MLPAIIMLGVGLGYGVLVDPIMRYFLRRFEKDSAGSVWVETILPAALPVSIAMTTESLALGGALVVRSLETLGGGVVSAVAASAHARDRAEPSHDADAGF